jgi:myo-inositol-1(or 4)-monophosphatase
VRDSPGEKLASIEDTAIVAARSAGAILIDRWNEARNVSYKGEIDLVTDSDHRSEEAIVAVVRARFPEHQILAEEGSVGGQSQEYRWIVDPLDGTTNYAHGYPHFSVSIALERGGNTLIGVVFDPVRDELFLARSGGGAWLNGRPLAVSAVDQLLRALACSGFPYDRARFGPVLKRWAHFAGRCQALRRTGSAALDICYVAAGRFDAFWEDSLHPWDAAAGVLLVQEAGGRVTNFAGAPADMYAGEVLVTNGALHDVMIAELANANGRQPRSERVRSGPRRRRTLQ